VRRERLPSLVRTSLRILSGYFVQSEPVSLRTSYPVCPDSECCGSALSGCLARSAVDLNQAAVDRGALPSVRQLLVRHLSAYDTRHSGNQ
jgi:hypothetical protein